MSRKSIANKFTLLLSLTLFFTAASIAGVGVTPKPSPATNPQTPDCSAATDKQIETEIGSALRKAFRPTPRNKADLRFAFHSKDRVVLLRGGTTGSLLYFQVLDIIRNIPSGRCLNGINVLNFKPTRPGGCGRGQKECNGGCISELEECNLVFPPG
jgi:hypothetical protein